MLSCPVIRARSRRSSAAEAQQPRLAEVASARSACASRIRPRLQPRIAEPHELGEARRVRAERRKRGKLGELLLTLVQQPQRLEPVLIAAVSARTARLLVEHALLALDVLHQPPNLGETRQPTSGPPASGSFSPAIATV